MDLNRVIGEVAARHGVRLDPDDPALVLVTVTELMLQQAQEEFRVSARQATAEFVEAAGRAQELAGAALAANVRRALGVLHSDDDQASPITDADLVSPSPLSAKADAEGRRCPLLATVISALFFVSGLLIGRLMS